MSADQQDLAQHAAESGWQHPPQPPVQPKKRHWVRWTILSAVAIFAVIIVASVVSGLNSATDSLNSATSTTSDGPASSSLNEKHPPAKDVKLGTLAINVLDVAEIPVTITNHSSKASDYIITIEITNPSGDRLDETAVFATDVAPRQTVKETAYGTADLSGKHPHAQVLRVERTAS
jgi:hypothetical protein